MKMNLKNAINSLSGKSKYAFRGGYYNHTLDTASVKSMNKRIQSQFYKKGKVEDFSRVNLMYFNKIVDLCQLNKVELVLINTPLHSFYRNNVPKVFLKKHQELINEYGFKIIDLSNLKMNDDCYVRDGDHVTGKGSLIATQEFNNYLKSNFEQL